MFLIRDDRVRNIEIGDASRLLSRHPRQYDVFQPFFLLLPLWATNDVLYSTYHAVFHKFNEPDDPQLTGTIHQGSGPVSGL